MRRRRRSKVREGGERQKLLSEQYEEDIGTCDHLSY